MKVSEKWLRDYIQADESIEKITDTLTMAGLEVKNMQHDEVLNDTIFEVEITSNRPDWLSYLGIAREIAALYNSAVVYPKVDVFSERESVSSLAVSVKDKKGCPFYAGILVKDVVVTKSPKEIQEKLLAIGLRPVNLLVDLTNVVLFETGQPMHAFDYDLLKGGCIHVRYARKDEPFMAINHNKYVLRETDLVICDAERPVALAGVMGGAESEVTDVTKNIFLESAIFDPAMIRNTARYHNLSSDASYRLERKVDIGMVRKAQDRFLTLLKQYGSFGAVSTVVCDGTDDAVAVTIDFNVDDVYARLGMAVDKNTIEDIFKNLGLGVKKGGSENILRVTVPTFRPDLVRSIDLIEEVARIYGYDKIPETFPPRVPQNDLLNDVVLRIESEIKDICVASGCFEVVPFTLIDERLIDGIAMNAEKFVRIVNPQHKDLRLMRPALLPGLLGVVSSNIRGGNPDLKLFEIGSTYIQEDGDIVPVETKTLGVVITGKTNRMWYEKAVPHTVFDVKGIIEHVSEHFRMPVQMVPVVHDFYIDTCSFSVVIKGKVVGVAGKVKNVLLKNFDIEQEVFACEIKVDVLKDYVDFSRAYIEPSKFPAVKRDIAVIVPHDVLIADMQETIQDIAGGLISYIELFDCFSGKQTGKDQKNVAFAMEFSAQDRTLSGEEIQEVFNRIAETLQSKYKASFRDSL